MTSDEIIHEAQLPAKRLEIDDWPTIWRVDDLDHVDIAIGDRDIVTIPANATTEADVLAAVLQYAYHNVNDEHAPTRQQIHTAAAGMTATDWDLWDA